MKADMSKVVVTSSAAEPQVIVVSSHKRMKALRRRAQMSAWPLSSGMASIDWSGLIGGNVQRWVKGL